METFFVFLLCIVFPGLLVIGGFGLFAWILFRQHGKKETLKKSLLLKWLKQQQQRGYTSTSDLIDSLKPPVLSQSPISKTHHNKKKLSEKNAISTPKVQQSNTLIDQLSANILLYIGALFVLFSAFVLVAFNWQTFSDIAKSILILLITGIFYGTGLICYHYKSVRSAGITFLFIASILFGLLGLGIWNFTFKEVLSIQFHEYWLIYSLLSLGIYGGTLFLLRLRRFLYLFIASIYSVLLTTALSVSNEYALRITLFSLSNFVLYLGVTLLKRKAQEIRFISSTVNFIVSLIALIGIFSLSQINPPLWVKLAAIGSLFIPTIFGFVAFWQQKLKLSFTFESLLFPLKLLLIIGLFNANSSTALMILSIGLFLFTTFAFLYIYKKIPLLDLISRITIIFIGGIISIELLLLWGGQNTDQVSLITQVESLIIVMICLLLPDILFKRKWVVALFLPYTIFAGFKTFSLFSPEAPLEHYLYFGLISLILWFTLHVTLYKIRRNLHIVIPFTMLLLSITLILMTTATSAVNAAIVFFAVAMILLFESLLFSSGILRVLHVVFALATALCFFYSIDNSFIGSIQITSALEGLLLIPLGFLYAFWGEFLYQFHQKKMGFCTYSGFILIAFFSGLMTIANDSYFFIFLVIITVYGFYNLFKFKKLITLYALFPILLLTGVVGGSLISLTGFESWTIAAGLSLLCNVIALWLYPHISGAGKLLAHHTRLLSLATAGLIYIFGFFAIFKPIEPFLISSLLLSSLTFLFSNNIRRLFGDLTGIGCIIILWHIAYTIPASAQYYVIPAFIYLLLLSIRYAIFKQKRLSMVLEVSAYIIEGFTLLLQSLTDEDQNKQVLYGLTLIGGTVIVLLLSLYRKKTGLIIFACLLLVLELIIRLYSVLLQIPWWIYVGGLGIGLMILAVIIFIKVAAKARN